MPENTSSETSGLISVIIGIVIIVVAVVGLIWLSDNGQWLSNRANSTSTPSEEEVSQILAELQKPALGSDGKPLPPPSEAEVAAMLDDLQGGGEDVPEPTEAEIQAMLKELQKPNSR